MIKQISIVIAFICIVVFAYAQPIVPPSPGNSVVYFTRISSLGFAINFTYFDSVKFVGRFNGANYLRYECNPGKHLFWARSENRDFIEADLLADKVYFIEAIPQMGAIKAGVLLDPINPADSAKMKKVFKLLNKKQPIVVTEAEIEAETYGLHSIIVNGMEKYQKDTAQGKQVLKLEPEMYYLE